MKKPVSIRLHKNEEEKLIELYNPRVGTSASEAIKVYLALRNANFYTLKKYFTNNELTGIITTFKDTEISYSWLCNSDINYYLLAEIKYKEQEGYLSILHRYSFNNLLKKIKALNVIQSFILLDDIRRFWSMPSGFLKEEERVSINKKYNPTIKAFIQYYNFNS